VKGVFGWLLGLLSRGKEKKCSCSVAPPKHTHIQSLDNWWVMTYNIFSDGNDEKDVWYSGGFAAAGWWFLQLKRMAGGGRCVRVYSHGGAGCFGSARRYL